MHHAFLSPRCISSHDCRVKTRVRIVAKLGFKPGNALASWYLLISLQARRQDVALLLLRDGTEAL